MIAAVLLIALAEPIFRLLFERGKFDAASTSEAALALICLAPGLVAFSMVNVLARAFFALGDTRTPMKVSMFCLTAQPAAGRGLVWRFKQGGLGIANTLTSLVNVGAARLTRCGTSSRRWNMASLRGPFLQLVVLAVFAGAGRVAGWRLWENSLGHETLALKIGAVFVPAGTAGLIYWLAALAFKIPAAKEMTEFALAKFVRR